MKVNDENSRIRIRNHQSEVWIRGSGSTPKCHGSATLDVRYQYDTIADQNSKMYKQFEWLFSRVLDSHYGGPGSIPGWDVSVLGPPVSDGNDLGQVSPNNT